MAKKNEMKQTAKQQQIVNVQIGDKAVKRKRGKRRPRKRQAEPARVVSGGFTAPIINFPPQYQYQNPASVQSLQQVERQTLVPARIPAPIQEPERPLIQPPIPPAGRPKGQARAKIDTPRVEEETETAPLVGRKQYDPTKLLIPTTEEEPTPSLERFGAQGETRPAWLEPEETKEERPRRVPTGLPEGSPQFINIFPGRPGSASSGLPRRGVLPPIERNEQGQRLTPSGKVMGRPRGSKNKPRIQGELITAEAVPAGESTFAVYGPESFNIRASKGRTERPAGMRPPSQPPLGPVEPVEPPPETISFLGQPTTPRQEPTIERRNRAGEILNPVEGTFI